MPGELSPSPAGLSSRSRPLESPAWKSLLLSKFISWKTTALALTALASLTGAGAALAAERLHIITFDEPRNAFASGDAVRSIRTTAGTVVVHGEAPRNPDPNDAMIFDATCSAWCDDTGVSSHRCGRCTGGDHDLKHPDQGNILIVSESGLRASPSDSGFGGLLSFDFSRIGLVRIESLTALDLEANTPAVARFYRGYELIVTEELPAVGDGGRGIAHLGVAHVERMEIEFEGSGAVDDVAFCVGDAADLECATLAITASGPTPTVDPGGSRVSPTPEERGGSSEAAGTVGDPGAPSRELMTGDSEGDLLDAPSLPAGTAGTVGGLEAGEGEPSRGADPVSVSGSGGTIGRPEGGLGTGDDGKEPTGALATSGSPRANGGPTATTDRAASGGSSADSRVGRGGTGEPGIQRSNGEPIASDSSGATPPGPEGRLAPWIWILLLLIALTILLAPRLRALRSSDYGLRSDRNLERCWVSAPRFDGPDYRLDVRLRGAPDPGSQTLSEN